MKNSSNLTIRISPELKQQFDEACEYLDYKQSDYLRGAMKSLVKSYQQARLKDTGYARDFIDGERKQIALNALSREIASEGGKATYKLNPDDGLSRQQRRALERQKRRA